MVRAYKSIEAEKKALEVAFSIMTPEKVKEKNDEEDLQNFNTEENIKSDKDLKEVGLAFKIILKILLLLFVYTY